MKRYFALFLAVAMVLCSFSASVFATEAEANEVENTSTATATSTTTAATATTAMNLPEEAEVIDVIDFDFDTNISIPITITSTTLVNNTWTFRNHHQGSTRKYAYNTIGFKIQVTDSNGNAVSDRISIQLHDTVNGGTQYYTAYANGALYGYNNISIVANRNYYFCYDNLSSSTRMIKIHMIIYH